MDSTLIRRVRSGEETVLSTHPQGSCPDHLPVGLIEAIVNEVKAGCKNVAFDLGGKPVLGSAGLSFLIRLHAAVRNTGGHTCIVDAPDRIKKILEVTELSRVISVQDSLSLAEQYFGQVESGGA